MMWYFENCFEAWSAHLLPQTGRDLGMRSCMIGMHGLHNLFNNIRWNVGPCVVWKCIGTWRNMLPTYLRTVGCPVFWCGRAGDITLLVVLETLGTLRYRTFAGINNWTTGGPWQGMRTGGQIWCHSSYPFAPNHEQDHLKGINVYIALLFSPVPFTGCLRACRFHFTSLLNKIAQKPVHGTTIVPHDGQQSSMMNEKHVQKKTRRWSSHRFGGRPGRLRGCTWKFLS